MDPGRPLLSICMIVKNEEAVLGRALASAAGMGAELVVVDTGSTDGTVAIAEAAGATVHHFAWIDDFSAARNFAFEKATGTWMLVLDADEEITAELRDNHVRRLGATKAAALRVPMIARDDRGEIQSTMLAARFVRNGRGYVYEGRVHEETTASIRRAGGTTEDASDLPLLHHGYTSAESARKDRRGRNRKLLEAAHAALPEEPRYWHYLGLELVAVGDHAGAAALFDRVLVKAPEHELAGWSACALASIHEAEHDLGTAWQVAELGLAGRIGRVLCLAKVGRIALREGDAETARWCADTIEKSPDDEMASRGESLAFAGELRAAARALKEPAQAKTRDHLLSVLAKLPGSALVAKHLVDTCEALEGRGKGTIDAIRRTKRVAAGATRTVTAAAMTSAFQRGADEECRAIGAASGVQSELSAFALARSGQVDRARDELLGFGESAATFAIVFGLAHDDAAAIAHGLAAATPAHRTVLDGVRAGKKVPGDLAWVLLSWLEHAVIAREDRVAGKLAASLPFAAEGLRLVFRFENEPLTALREALERPTELASLEVIGLVAHGHGDFAAAATMLGTRARAGDAAVRVHLKAADAFTRLGRNEDAAAMLELGRDARPLSRSWAAPAKHLRRSA